MAITAVVTLTPTSAAPNQQVTATVAISNSGASDVEVIGGAPIATIGGGTSSAVPINCGILPLFAGADLTVPAGGSLNLSFGVVCFKPEVSGESDTYDIGCGIQTSDGSNVTATVDTLTITGNAEASA